MSYETDVMRNLTLALRDNNKNIEVLKYLSLELRRANELKEIELGLRKVEDYSFNQNNQKKKKKSFNSKISIAILYDLLKEEDKINIFFSLKRRIYA